MENKDEILLEKLSHDIKNPLSVIRMNLDLFQLSKEYKEGGEKAKQIVEVINREIDRILDILKDSEINK